MELELSALDLDGPNAGQRPSSALKVAILHDNVARIHEIAETSGRAIVKESAIVKFDSPRF
jgi:hypothetical protein